MGHAGLPPAADAVDAADHAVAQAAPARRRPDRGRRRRAAGDAGHARAAGVAGRRGGRGRRRGDDLAGRAGHRGPASRARRGDGRAVEEEYRAITADAPGDSRSVGDRSGAARSLGCGASCAGSARATTSHRPGATARGRGRGTGRRGGVGGGGDDLGDPSPLSTSTAPPAPGWLRRFVDPDAEFVFVDDPDEVPADATPFDMRGVELGHRDGRCSFESILVRYQLDDPALERIGRSSTRRTSATTSTTRPRRPASTRSCAVSP